MVISIVMKSGLIDHKAECRLSVISLTFNGVTAGCHISAIIFLINFESSINNALAIKYPYIMYLLIIFIINNK